ncbi:MAG: 5-formyltetrahydrofolate cyclo-ligase [Alphaproteobacteria bacterium]|nr:MAG: 5-formyltetrahydrofolate cyclo-ligase [Alphaproteobacteria bacterium]
MPATDPKPKTAVRAAARQTRARAFERFGERVGAILTANFLAQFSHPPGVDMAGYWPTNEEADIRPLMTALHQRGHRLALPRVMARGAPLRFLRWHPGDRLEAGFGGIPEPAAGAEEIHPEVLLVPLLGFDGTGLRLGYGGGFYDRTLAALRRAGGVEAIGIAFSDQEVDSLPAGDHDERLDWVVTESGCRRFGQSS